MLGMRSGCFQISGVSILSFSVLTIMKSKANGFKSKTLTDPGSWYQVTYERDLPSLLVGINGCCFRHLPQLCFRERCGVGQQRPGSSMQWQGSIMSSMLVKLTDRRWQKPFGNKSASSMNCMCCIPGRNNPWCYDDAQGTERVQFLEANWNSRKGRVCWV